MRDALLFFTCCMLGSSVRLCAQLTNANWYFGNGAGLTFPNGGAPTPLAGSALYTLEGVACISDEAGQLLFYTDGVTVYTSNGQIMPNGTGLNGHASSTQSALIVRDPGDPDLYHLFTVAAEASLSSTGYTGLSHSTVDMQLNDGLGDVVVINEPVIEPTCEKLTAVRHANGRDVWVVAHGFGNANYYAFLLTCNGIQAPVTSAAGRYMGPAAAGEVNEQAIGQLDISPDGRYAASIWRRGLLNGGREVAIDVLAFDDLTGTFTLLDSITHSPPGCDLFGIGLSFAPGSRLLYTAEGGSILGAPVWRIHQFDMEAADIAGSEVQLVDMQDANFGAMACGPDGVIYIADPFTMDRLRTIRFPDIPGLSCGLDTAGITLNAPVYMGLPNLWENTRVIPAEAVAISLRDTTACVGPVTIEVQVEPVSSVVSYAWSTGSGTSTTVADTAGRYRVQMVFGCDTSVAEAHVAFSAQAVDLGLDQNACEGTEVHLHVPEWAAQWTWADEWELPERTMTSSGTTVLAVVDSLGCASADTLSLVFVDCDCRPYIPNAFTPNGDGINDSWSVTLDCAFDSFALRVFDRWGRPVFGTDRPGRSWDGMANGVQLPSGIYAWTLDPLRSTQGGPTRAASHGHVVLVR